MKRFLIFIVATAVAAVVQAQRGLAVEALFDGLIVPKDQMVETMVRGKEIAPYQLTLFRSLRFMATEKQKTQVIDLFNRDAYGKHALGSTSKKSSTLLLQLQPQNGKNRFLCMKTKSVRSIKSDLKAEIIVVYMEGSLNSLERLNDILNSK